MSRKNRPDPNAPLLLEAMTEVTRTILANPGFFPARDRRDIRDWVQKLFPDTPAETLDEHFDAVLINPDLPWGKKRFVVAPDETTRESYQSEGLQT